jgi:proteasome lid subunit RPN8/RPN11
LIYVALTRARDHLVLVHIPQPGLCESWLTVIENAASAQQIIPSLTRVAVQVPAERAYVLDPETFPRTAERAYVLDPRLIADAEADGKTLVAIAHSHCIVGAYFSDEDVRAALSPFDDGPLYPGVDYVVLDAQADGVRGHKVFGWSESAGAFVEV